MHGEGKSPRRSEVGRRDFLRILGTGGVAAGVTTFAGWRTGLTLSLSALVLGCTIGPDYARPKLTPPETFRGQVTPSEAVRNAGRLLKDAGAAAVKVEGGSSVTDVVRRLVDVGIPVMGHLGVTPQSVNQQSGYRQRGGNPHDADIIVNDALALQGAGVFAVVLESIPSDLAARVTAELDVPTIGIGAGPDCDGQVLVISDVLGLHDKVPPFAKKYVDLADVIVGAARAFVEDVRAGNAIAPTRPAQVSSGEPRS